MAWPLSHSKETSLKFSPPTFPGTKTKNTVGQVSSHVHIVWTLPSVATRSVIALPPSLFLLKLRKLEDAIEDCTNAVKLDDTYVKAYLRRAQW